MKTMQIVVKLNLEIVTILRTLTLITLAIDSSLQKTRNALNASRASHRDVLSLKNWLDANACISGPEVQYLQHQDDLFSLGLSGDGATRAIEVWLEDKLIQYYPKFRKVYILTLRIWDLS